eukprot:CAMPEP_0185802806 /NCGR_PEP_ID=MMETSP1322-20130828/2202_1 /TAXON_ID=265543 /ORGANISM="Minutocellus polymorphus, Strain RCC2270" /LENGTH=398 /DNA_ID=CAMNT_0028498591 /DNA_START=315 /DNA_END=1511 /DNA_ORIENTATION=-
MINKAPAPALTMKLFFVSVLLASVAVVQAERVRHPPGKKGIDVARPNDHQMEETQKEGEETVGHASRRTDPLPDTASTASTPLKRSVSADAIRSGPPPIAADDEPVETAEEATVDVGLLEAAKDKDVAGTGRRLQPSCPKGFVDCRNGLAYGNVNPTKTCFQACKDGKECCAGTDACTNTTACIEKDKKKPNCVGTKACYKVGFDSTSQPNISGGSCTDDSACEGFASNGGEVGSINESCKGAYACYLLAEDGGSVGSISKSCIGIRACDFLALGGGNVTSISKSCTDGYACDFLAGIGGNVGSIEASCIDEFACVNLARDNGEVGDICNSCRDKNCCEALCEANNPSTLPPGYTACATTVPLLNFCLPASAKNVTSCTSKSTKSPKSAKVGKSMKSF